MDTPFWKHIVLVCTFFLLTPVALVTSIFSLMVLARNEAVMAQTANDQNLIHVPQSGISVYASLPSGQPTVGGVVETGDAREEIVRQYLAAYNSPLEPHAGTIVAAADAYEVDYRLTTAIAQQESNLCKKMPAGTFNCWGWGIHSEGTLGFRSFEEGIWTVTQGLKEDYINLEFDTIEKIMSKYTPLSKGSWAQGVNTFLQEMR